MWLTKAHTSQEAPTSTSGSSSLSELGYSLSAQGKYEKAIEKFEYILSLKLEDEGNLEFIYSQLAWCHRHLWKIEKALEYLYKAKEEGRNNAWINVEMALCYENLEEHEKALEYALIAYELDKNDVHVLSELGVIYGCMEKYEEAIEVLLESRQISLAEEDEVDGEDFELAYCYIGIGDKENAQKYLDLARDSVIKQGDLNGYVKEYVLQRIN